MSGFSSRDEEVIRRTIDTGPVLYSTPKDELVKRYNLGKCVTWIKDKNLQRVCLQFPDSLLCDSVSIALWFEEQLGRKVYILGDTSYGSCCVDEVAAEHAESDGIIHFGHSCLSPSTRLPVFYVFPKSHLDVERCISSLKLHLADNQLATLLVFDVSYYHYSNAVRNGLSDFDKVVFSEPVVGTNSENSPCNNFSCCRLSSSTEETTRQHAITRLGQTYCQPADSDIGQLIYIGAPDSQPLYNHRVSYSGPVYSYYEDSLQPVSLGKSLQRRWYLMERLRDAKTIGIVVATLGVDGYLDAIRRIRLLARRRQKKCYVISVGKPNAAKLANFPEIEVYVMVSCPEAVLENEKDFLQPVVSMNEAELALNESRSWTDIVSCDFRDFIPGGKNFVPLPADEVPVDKGEPDVSLLSNRIRCDFATGPDSSDGNEDARAVQVRAKMAVDIAASSSLKNRSWQGLDPAFGQTPVVSAVKGRSGIASGYSEEQEDTRFVADGS